MEFLRAQGYKLSYKDGLQLDGAFSAAHINYGKSPEFNEDIFEDLDSFNGTEKDFKKADRIELWKKFRIFVKNIAK